MNPLYNFYKKEFYLTFPYSYMILNIRFDGGVKNGQFK